MGGYGDYEDYEDYEGYGGYDPDNHRGWRIMKVVIGYQLSVISYRLVPSLSRDSTLF